MGFRLAAMIDRKDRPDWEYQQSCLSVSLGALTTKLLTSEVQSFCSVSLNSRKSVPQSSELFLLFNQKPLVEFHHSITFGDQIPYEVIVVL